jgi:hypothetical protein
MSVLVRTRYQPTHIYNYVYKCTHPFANERTQTQPRHAYTERDRHLHTRARPNDRSKHTYMAAGKISPKRSIIVTDMMTYMSDWRVGLDWINKKGEGKGEGGYSSMTRGSGYCSMTRTHTYIHFHIHMESPKDLTAT